MPTAIPDAIRARVLTELARQLGQYGGKDRLAAWPTRKPLRPSLHSTRPTGRAEEQEEPFDDDDIE